MLSGVSKLTCSSQSDRSVQSKLHSLNYSISLTLVLWLCLLWCVLLCVFPLYWFASIVLYSCYDIYVYVYLYCCDGFCGERRCYVRLCLSWIAVLIAPTNCLKFVWWVQTYLCCCYLTYYGVHMTVYDLVWDCDGVWHYFGGTILNEKALNGLNVTMGYCIRFGFKGPNPWSFVFDPLQVQIWKCLVRLKFCRILVCSWCMDS